MTTVRTSREASAGPDLQAGIQTARERVKAYLAALRAAGHKVRALQAPRVRGSSIACRISIDGFGVTAQYADFGDRWIADSKAVSEIWDAVGSPGADDAAAVTAAGAARRRSMLRDEAKREKKMRILRARQVREWNASVERAKAQLPRYVNALRSAGYGVKVFLDHKRGRGEKQMPKALLVGDQMIYITYGPPWSAKDREVEEYWRMLDSGKRPGDTDLGGKLGPAVIFSSVRDAEMFNRFKILCAMLTGRTAASGGDRDIATFTGLSGDAIESGLAALVSVGAVRKQKASAGDMSASVSDLLGWKSQEEHELTERGLAEVASELKAWRTSKSHDQRLARTIECRLERAVKAARAARTAKTKRR
jgi:hypothetical protein